MFPMPGNSLRMRGAGTSSNLCRFLLRCKPILHAAQSVFHFAFLFYFIRTLNTRYQSPSPVFVHFPLDNTSVCQCFKYASSED